MSGSTTKILRKAGSKTDVYEAFKRISVLLIGIAELLVNATAAN